MTNPQITDAARELANRLVISDLQKGTMTIDELSYVLIAALQRVRFAAIEECAELVENGQEVVYGNNTRSIEERFLGNKMGIAYAEAIRSLANPTNSAQ